MAGRKHWDKYCMVCAVIFYIYLRAHSVLVTFVFVIVLKLEHVNVFLSFKIENTFQMKPFHKFVPFFIKHGKRWLAYSTPHTTQGLTLQYYVLSLAVFELGCEYKPWNRILNIETHFK